MSNITISWILKNGSAYYKLTPEQVSSETGIDLKILQELNNETQINLSESQVLAIANLFDMSPNHVEKIGRSRDDNIIN